MALEGSLTDFGLADILQLIYFQRKTGVLILEGRMDRVRLSFIEGNISDAESKKRLDDKRLGKILLKKGYIKDADLLEALEEQKSTAARLGSLLLKRGVVDKSVITDVVKGQITETVVQLFGWKQGTYEFTSQGVPQDKDLPLSVDTQHLLMEGLRIMDEWSIIREKITLDTVFVRTTESPELLSPEEEEIVRLVDGENDVSTIIDIIGQDSFQTSKILLGLLDKGMIEAIVAPPVIAEFGAAGKRYSPFMKYLPYAALILSFILSSALLYITKDNGFREIRAAGKINDLRLRIEAYRLRHDAYPETLAVVTSETDPWGRPYYYRASDHFFYLSSKGPDGLEKTGDDIY